MDTMDAPDDAPRKRISTACEACRATKIRCQPSEHPGVCQKCLASKRECISRTGPRIRRSRRANLAPPAGPSRTFSIDFEVPGRGDIDSGFETLREAHAAFLDSLFPDDPAAEPAPAAPAVRAPAAGVAPARAATGTPPGSSAPSSLPIDDLRGRPSFNLASAESLLASFRGMLAALPCVVLPADATVPQLAGARPFVLLAILAAASGSRTLQGHNLYDDEFRKVLGLKYVAGGERSLELLQGILIYCAWFPFHLRPKNQQALQYLRMAADLLHELELDQPSAAPLTDARLDGMRAYLAYVYLVTTHVVSWKGRWGSQLPVSFTPWTLACCDALERHARVDGDVVLATAARLSRILFDASRAMHDRSAAAAALPANPSAQHGRLVLSGLEQQFLELQARMPLSVASAPPVSLQAMFVDIYLDSGSLLKIPRAAHPNFRDADGPLPPSAVKLYDATAKLRNLLSHITHLDEPAFLAFTLDDWVRFILAVICALRLSFPIPECPEFDPAWARAHLQFDHFLDHICRETDLTPAAKKVDVLSASRVIMGVVRDKYRRRLQTLLDTDVDNPGRGNGCPIVDASLAPYFPMWDDAAMGHMAIPHHEPQPPPAPPAPVENVSKAPFHDLWATMTMDWVHEAMLADQQ